MVGFRNFGEVFQNQCWRSISPIYHYFKTCCKHITDKHQNLSQPVQASFNQLKEVFYKSHITITFVIDMLHTSPCTKIQHLHLFKIPLSLWLQNVINFKFKSYLLINQRLGRIKSGGGGGAGCPDPQLDIKSQGAIGFHVRI